MRQLINDPMEEADDLLEEAFVDLATLGTMFATSVIFGDSFPSKTREAYG